MNAPCRIRGKEEEKEVESITLPCPIKLLHCVTLATNNHSKDYFILILDREASEYRCPSESVIES